MASFDSARAVRDQLVAAFESDPRFAGAGIAEDQGGDFTVVLNFRGQASARVPSTVNNVRVKTSVVSPAVAGPLRRRR